MNPYPPLADKTDGFCHLHIVRCHRVRALPQRDMRHHRRYAFSAHHQIERHRADFNAVAQNGLDVTDSLAFIRHPGWTWRTDLK